MLGLQQEVEHTASRRSGPRRWLRAVVWAVAAGLHPRAGATTQRIAEDLAARMDYSTGHVRYALDDMAARLGLSRATVKRHVAVLREMGLLAWLVHGTKANIRRALGLRGYAGTATVYAAVIPPAFDTAMGHVRIGSGYAARIVVPASAGPAGPVADFPVAGAGEPPSLNVVKEEGELKVEVGGKDTSRERASRSTASTSPTIGKRSSGTGVRRRSPVQVARDCRIAAQVRPRVNWTQSEGIRRLAFALRPLIDQGLDVHDIVAELGSWWLTWRPARPAAYIRAQLAARAQHAAAAAGASGPGGNAAWRAWLDSAARTAGAGLETAPARTDAERQLARKYACNDLQAVVDHLAEHGPDDALDLYGPRLVSLAERLAASGARFAPRW